MGNSCQSCKVVSQYLNVIRLLAVLEEINREGHMRSCASYNHINVYVSIESVLSESTFSLVGKLSQASRSLHRADWLILGE